MKTKVRYSLLAGLLLAVFLAVVLWAPSLTHLVVALTLALPIVGITITYPGAQSGGIALSLGTNPPSVLQAQSINTLVAQLVWADADTVAVITHNWGLGTTGATPNTGQLFPRTLFVQLTSTASAIVPIITVLPGQNICTINKTSAVGSGGTAAVYIDRPHSIIQ